MKQIRLLFYISFLSSTVYAQFQNPPSIKWKQINAKHSKVIFPVEIEKDAQRVANTIDYLYEFQSNSLSAKPKKIPILLFNRTTISNAYAALRPWRSVWYTTPSQFTTSLSCYDWLTLLATHEYRHIVQYTKFNQNFTKFLNTLFGQKGILIGEYSAPNWFFEGDAVCAETGFSLGGRGRIPQFEMAIKTLLLSGEKYSYDKAKFRSYKDYYPSHYQLGWLLTSFGRKKYGKDLWSNVSNHTSKISFWPYAFSLGMKKYTGKNEKKFYNEAMESLAETWKNEYKDLDITEAKTINQKRKKIWTRYSEPYYIPGGDILVKKSDFKSLPCIYRISPDGEERMIRFIDGEKISISGNKIVWARHIPDPRWEYRNYSDIIIFDTNSKIERQLTVKGKFFAPSFSNDGSKIAVVEYLNTSECSLVILDAQTGKEINRYPSKDNEFIRTPSWSEDDDRIVYTNTKYGGTALTILDTKTGNSEEILSHSYENIGLPIFYKNFIIYNSPYSGIGNIYAVDIDSKKRFQITSRKFGAYNPNVQDNKMVFMDYTVEGYDIAEVSLKPSEWKSIENVKSYESERVKTLFKQEQNKNLFDYNLIPQKQFNVTKYKKLKNGIKIHSWGPGTDADSKLFLDIVSANPLNTIFVSAGGEYDVADNTAKTFLNIKYAGIYPVFDLTGSYGLRNNNYLLPVPNSNLYYEDSDIWNELKGGIKITVPLNLSRGLYKSGLKLSSKYEYTQTYGKEYKNPWELFDGSFSSLIYSGTVYSLRQKSLRDINSRFGTIIRMSFTHTPFPDDFNGYQYSTSGILYIPGFFKNHSIKIRGGYEKQKEYIQAEGSNYYWFSSKQSFTRGYDLPAYENMSFTSVEYQLPILYPEFGLGPLLYFKRLRGGVYYDRSVFSPLGFKGETYLYHSVGAELHLELRLFRIDYPIEIGCRVSYLFSPNSDGKEIVPEFLLFGVPLNFK